MDLLTFLTSISLLLGGIFLFLTRNYNYWTKQGVKSPSVFTSIFNTVACIFSLKTPQAYLNELYKFGEGEKFVGFYVFDKAYLLIRDPECVKNVFIKDFNNFSNKILGANEADYLGKHSVFMIHNPPWKSIRSQLTSVFTSGRVKKMFDLILDIGKNFDVFLDKLNVSEKMSTPIEVKEICGKLMTDLIGITAFGLRLNSLIDHNAEFRRYGREMFKNSYSRYLQMLSIFFIPQLRPLTKPKFFDDKGSVFLRKELWQVINQRMDSGINRNDLIDALVEIKKRQDSGVKTDHYRLEGDALVAQAAIFYTGGFETTSTTLTFALYELAVNQDVQKRLRDEIMKAFDQSGGKITYEMVTNLPYIDMVIHETMRIYPVIPWLDRVAENDYEFSGVGGSVVKLKKGTPVILPARSLQMDEKYFSNPTKFDPERFSEENRKHITACTFFPFGQGPRNCIGERLGKIQVKLGLIYFVSKFEITPSRETPIPMVLSNINVYIQSAEKLMLNFRKIT